MTAFQVSFGLPFEVVMLTEGFASEVNRLFVLPVSYTHLTLPTKLEV